ncbi:MAG: ABC transporter substrate-binding protein [Treponema sp.]|nr:ABC transporter substrate-binding protein [Treponema sp.]
MGKKVLVILLCLTIVGSLFAGGRTQAPTAGRDNLNFGLVGEPRTMDPVMVSDLVSFSIFFQIYDFLIRREANDTMQPGLATRWEYSPDGTQITFHLRRGVLFHDGTEMKAEDVAFSFNRAIASAFTSGSTNMMDRMDVIDDYTVRLYLHFAYGPIEFCISGAQMGIISKAHYERDPDGFARNPIGSGPYRYVDWRAGNEINLTRHDAYWKGPAPIKDIRYRIILDGNVAVMALQNGEIDIIDTPPVTERTNLRADPNITYLETEIAAWVFLAFNNEPGRLFSDVRLRRAFAMAIDKPNLILGAREGLGTAIETPWPNSVNLWNPNFRNVQYNPDGARQLLAQAGYGPNNPLRVNMMTTDSITYLAPTEVIQGQLERVGVIASIERLERTAYFSAVMDDRNYDVCVMAATTPIPDPDQIYATFHSNQLATGRNYYNVNDPNLDRLLDAGRRETNQAVRQRIYDEISEIFRDQVYSFPLYTYYTNIAHNRNLNGVIINAHNRMFVHDFSW